MSSKPVMVVTTDKDTRVWTDALQAALGEIRCVMLDEEGYDPADVIYASVLRPPKGFYSKFPNLRCVASVAAGIDHMLPDPGLPEDLPVLRLNGPALRARMREWVLLHVLVLHKRSMNFLAGQKLQEWRKECSPAPADCPVGILGMGELGADCARALQGVGFPVSGWSRSAKKIPNVRSFHGPAQLPAFCKDVQILVNLLPLTPETDSILNAGLFAALGPGAGLVSAGRGQHLVEEDLLAGLASGQMGGAVLDVFRTEPLPAGHPFWDHPKIWVTPHVAAEIDPATTADMMAAAIRRFEAEGGGVRVHRDLGY